MNRSKPVCSYNGAYCYAELAVSSPAVAEIVASTHCTYLQRCEDPIRGLVDEPPKLILILEMDVKLIFYGEK